MAAVTILLYCPGCDRYFGQRSDVFKTGQNYCPACIGDLVSAPVVLNPPAGPAAGTEAAAGPGEQTEN